MMSAINSHIFQYHFDSNKDHRRLRQPLYYGLHFLLLVSHKWRQHFRKCPKVALRPFKALKWFLTIYCSQINLLNLHMNTSFWGPFQSPFKSQNENKQVLGQKQMCLCFWFKDHIHQCFQLTTTFVLLQHTAYSH